LKFLAQGAVEAAALVGCSGSVKDFFFGHVGEAADFGEAVPRIVLTPRRVRSGKACMRRRPFAADLAKGPAIRARREQFRAGRCAGLVRRMLETYVQGRSENWKVVREMSSSSMRFMAFVVLTAVVLATGFGAFGAVGPL
jgi:hypothetical protein